MKSALLAFACITVILVPIPAVYISESYAATNSPSQEEKEAFALLRWKASLDNKSQSLLSSWDTTSKACYWAGLGCDDDGRIARVNLTSYAIKGKLYDVNFSFLPHLVSVDLHNNSLTVNEGKIYSVNEGNAKNWDGPTAKYVEKCKFPKDGSPAKSLRYIGSMVADVHRTLLYGGIFLYPAEKKSPNGKLRVLYEVFPMSFLMEQAGGQAFTGKQRATYLGRLLKALDLVPKKIHERSPIFLGSYDDVEEIKALYAAEEQK